MKKLFIAIAIIFATVAYAYAADKVMKWDAASGATGYKIYMSQDQGATWDAGTDVGNVTTYTYQNVPDDKLILFRISAYNAQAEVIRYQDGIWYNGTFQPPAQPSGYGMQ